MFKISSLSHKNSIEIRNFLSFLFTDKSQGYNKMGLKKDRVLRLFLYFDVTQNMRMVQNIMSTDS